MMSEKGNEDIGANPISFILLLGSTSSTTRNLPWPRLALSSYTSPGRKEGAVFQVNVVLLQEFLRGLGIEEKVPIRN